MKNQGSLVAIIVVSLIGLTVMIFGSLKKTPRLAETTAMADVFAVPETAAFAQTNRPETSYPEVTSALVDQGRLIIGTSEGIFILPSLVGQPEPEERRLDTEITHLNLIVPFEDNRYIGADYLYKVDNNYAVTLDRYDLGTRVYSMLGFGDGLLVGTDIGLWYHCDFEIDGYCAGDTLLKEGLIVTSMAEDRGGLWVGTYGQGLYRFDGEKWRERYLERDTLMFQFVNALEYSHPFLWVGTDESIFRYDGGTWQQMFIADSSETFDVTCVMTTPAATYIGTGSGLLRFAGDSLYAVDGFEGMAVAGLCVSDRDVIVATRNNGIFTFNGKEELVSPEQLTPRDFAGLAEPSGNVEDKVLAETDPDILAENIDY